MYEVRQIIQRLRLGETDRSIARSQRVGRHKVAQIRALAAGQNWLDAASPIPDDALIAAHTQSSARSRSAGTTPNTSSVEAYREEILASGVRQFVFQKPVFLSETPAAMRVQVAISQNICGGTFDHLDPFY